MSPVKSVDLFLKEGSSDKEYHAQIVGAEGTGYAVNFQYGRVGNKLQAGTKTKAPVDLKTAERVYDELVSSKMKGGYQPKDGAGVSYQQVSEKKVLGVLPQLLNFIDEDEIPKYINDDTWVMQEKKDGVRSLIKKSKKIIEGGNKKGQVTSLPLSVVDDIQAILGAADGILDGELVGETYWLFDLLSIGVHSLAGKAYQERLEAIQEWIIIPRSHDHVKLVPTAVGKASKKEMYARLKRENAEGVVFKKLDAVYKPGRPASGGSQVKFKFYAAATVRVRALNETKESFQMELLARGDWEYVGDCTYYPTKYVPKAGHYVEVRYLYAYPGGSLFQPTCLGQRKDCDDSDCVKSQLKYKQGTTEDDEE